MPTTEDEVRTRRSETTVGELKRAFKKFAAVQSKVQHRNAQIALQKTMLAEKAAENAALEEEVRDLDASWRHLLDVAEEVRAENANLKSLLAEWSFLYSNSHKTITPRTAENESTDGYGTYPLRVAERQEDERFEEKLRQQKRGNEVEDEHDRMLAKLRDATFRRQILSRTYVKPYPFENAYLKKEREEDLGYLGWRERWREECEQKQYEARICEQANLNLRERRRQAGGGPTVAPSPTYAELVGLPTVVPSPTYAELVGGLGTAPPPRTTAGIVLGGSSSSSSCLVAPQSSSSSVPRA